LSLQAKSSKQVDGVRTYILISPTQRTSEFTKAR